MLFPLVVLNKTQSNSNAKQKHLLSGEIGNTMNKFKKFNL